VRRQSEERHYASVPRALSRIGVGHVLLGVHSGEIARRYVRERGGVGGQLPIRRESTIERRAQRAKLLRSHASARADQFVRTDADTPRYSTYEDD